MPAAAVGALAAGAASVAATAITSGFAAVTLATFAVPAAIALGTGLIARAFAPKPPGLAGPGLQSQRAARSVGAVSGTTAQNINAPISAARWILGQVRCTGRVVWLMVHDDDVFVGRTTVPGGWVSNARYDTGDETTQTVDDVQNIYISTIDNNIGNEPPGTGWKFVDSVENATKKDTVSDLHMALVLSEGPCEGIDEIWLDGEELTVTKATSGGHNVFTAPGFECHEYFRADGTEGAESFAAASAGSSELTWDAASVQGKGLSWVYVKLTQNDYGRDIDSRRYNRIPNIEFVVKGLKIGAKRNPNSGAKTWTENAAIIRKWWLTERRGINWRDINNAYYNAAVQRCDTTIDISNLDNFDSTAMQSNLKRYTVNGIISSGDDVVRIEEDMDYAWDGSVVSWDGEYLFRPGGDRTSVREIVPDDIVEEPLYRPGTILNSNRYLCSLPQSEWHDWLPYDIRVDDIGKQDYDGTVQTLNLGPAAFVSNPAQAANLLRSAARRARASSSIELTIKPGDAFESASIVPGDKVTLSLPEFGISDQDYMVVTSRVLAGWAIRVVLAEWGSDWFDDSLSLEHYSPRQVIPTSGRRLVAPSPVTVLIAAATDGDGKFTWYALVTAPESLFELYIRYKHADSENYQEWSSFSHQTVINLTQAGFWDFEVHHRSRDGRVSPATEVRAEATFDVNLPPLPVLARKNFSGGFARWVFSNLGPFVNGIEVAYTYEAPGSTSSPGLLNEAGWDAADKLGQYPIVPAKRLTEERTVVQLLPSFGSFNFYARGVDIAGRETGLVHLGLVDYTLDAPTNVDVDVYGDGTRAYLFTLPDNESVAGCQIRYKKAGDNVPEPGPIENAPPTLVAANVTEDGDILLAYSEPLDEGSTPAVGAFSVDIGGSSSNPASIDIDSNTVLLTLSTKASAGAVVTLSFTNPTSNPLQDTHDEAAADFSAHPVNNILRGVGNEVDWLSMERLHEGYITAAPYLAKLPGAGIWDVAFRTQAVSGHLSDIARVQVTLGEPVQLDIVTAVQQAIADNPALVTLTDEVTRAQDAERKARAAATEAEAAKTAAETAKTAAELAEAAAEQAETNVNTAKAAVDKAEEDAAASASTAESEAAKASASAGKAATSETNADGSETAAAAHVRSAQAEANKAGNSASAAATSASTAASEASDAETSATAAETAQTKAETAQSKAETAETNASSSATAADGSADAAASSLSSVKASATAAETAKDDAETAESNAETSASAAAESAKTASASKDDAGDSATAAAASRTAAETAQSKAETAESNASTSATEADGSAKAAASSASGVTASVNAAKTSEDNAAASATAAAASASTAEAAKTAAGQSASAAATSATSAQTDAATAGTASQDAATSKTAADGSAQAAATSAQAAAASATLASGAGDSATAAATSAQTATAKATEAATSASAAATSATEAQTASSAAKVSETNAAASKTAADGAAALATTEKEAAAGFAGDAKQAVAGVSQTASAAVNSQLQTTFASIVALRAVAGEARAKFEVVALSDPSGSRAAGVMTGDLQSFDYAPAGGNVPGAFAHGNIVGIYVQHRTVGTAGNSNEIEIRKRRDPNRGSPRNAIASANSGGRRIVYLTDDSGTGEQVTFKRADIANAIRGASFINTARVTASGDLRVTIANDGSNVDERVALITLSGGRAAVASVGGTGWRISRNGTAEFGAGVIRGKLKASQIDVTDLNASGIVANTVNFGTATITGTLSADHISSDVKNWEELVAPTSRGSTTTPGDGSWQRLFNAELTGYDEVAWGASVNGYWYYTQIVPLSVLPTYGGSSTGGRLVATGSGHVMSAAKVISGSSQGIWFQWRDGGQQYVHGLWGLRYPA